jgi:hypothetical protein
MQAYTHTKDSKKISLTLDHEAILAEMVASSEVRDAVIGMAETAAINRTSESWKEVKDGEDNTAWFITTCLDKGRESIRVITSDRKQAESLLPRTVGASPEKLAAAGKALGFDEPCATDIDGLARQFAKKRISEAQNAIDAAKEIL